MGPLLRTKLALVSNATQKEKQQDPPVWKKVQRTFDSILKLVKDPQLKRELLRLRRDFQYVQEIHNATPGRGALSGGLFMLGRPWSQMTRGVRWAFETSPGEATIGATAGTALGGLLGYGGGRLIGAAIPGWRRVTWLTTPIGTLLGGLFGVGAAAGWKNPRTATFLRRSQQLGILDLTDGAEKAKKYWRSLPTRARKIKERLQAALQQRQTQTQNQQTQQTKPQAKPVIQEKKR